MAARGVAKLAQIAASMIIIALLITISSPWSLDVVKAYDGTLLECQCSHVTDDREAMHRAITSTMNSLVSGAKPGPPSAYVCVIPDRTDDQPDVWGWATCAERITKDDCQACLKDARDSLMNVKCPGSAGAHLYEKDCSIQYESYEFCHS